MIDSDQDGVVTSSDFVFLQNTLDQQSRFAKEEIQPLVLHYERTHLTIYGFPSELDAVVFDKYK